MKKVVTMLLCAVLLVSLLAVSVFAAEPYHFAIAPAKTELVAGEEIKFNVTAHGAADCDILGLLLDFDRDVFEFVKGTCNPVAEDEDGNDLIAAKSFSTAAGKEGFAVSFLQPITYNGRVGNFTLRVKEGVNVASTNVTLIPSLKLGAGVVGASVDTITLTMTPAETEAPTTEAPTTEAPTTEATEAPTTEATEAPTEHVHTWVEHAAVAPTCDFEGNIAYKQCSECGEAWSLGENPMPLGRYGWVVAATGHTWVEHDAVAPTCDFDGNIAYEQCSVCGAAQTAGENPMPLGRYGWVVSATGHSWVPHEAVAPSCGVEGNIAYEQCSNCGAAQTAGENPMPLGRYGWVVAALEHNWVEHAAVAPSCNAEGNIAYAQCSNCGAAQTVGENPMPLGMYGWVLGPTNEHTFEHHDAIEATCYEDGHYAFDYCTTCQCFFYEDPLMLTFQAGIIPAGHAWVNYEAVAPTCTTEGNIAYQRCSVCGAAQTWSENPVPLGLYGWVLGGGGSDHTWVTVQEIPATCVDYGYVAQECSGCGVQQNWSPEPTNTHIVENGVCIHCGMAQADFNCEHTNNIILGQEAATCTMQGFILYQCNDCNVTWTEILLVVPHAFVNGTCSECGIVCTEHNYVTVQEIPATCVEYGYVAQKCTNCGYEKNWSPEPTNVHIIENGVCIHCGLVQPEFTCEHTNNTVLGHEDATCTMEGWTLYQCGDCRQTWVETLAVVPHAYEHGICTICGLVCEHNYELVQNIAPTCDEYGYIAYACSICGNETNTSPDPLGHTWVAHEAVAPSCNAEGNIAYEQCSACGAAQTAGENPMPLGMYGWVLGPTGEHTFEHHDAVAATCDTDGHYAFDYCTTCECFFYEDALMLTYQAGVIPALGHTWVDYAEVAPTCDTEGNIAYQQCSVCGAAQTAGENPLPLGLYGWVLGATGHTWVAHEAVAPSCNAEGNIAYEQCSVCGAAQTVGENPMPLGLYGWVLGPTGEHTFEHYDAVAATCDTDGHYAFDYCTTCECFFYEDPMLLTYQAGVIPALGHTWVAHEAVAPTCFEPGNIAYEQCSVCGAAQTAGENPMPLSMYGWVLGVTHNIAHVEAVAPTYEANGNVEYWYCTECGYAWTDANLTQVTNLLSVILPALETPATGDETPVVALIVLAVAAVTGLAVVVVNKKRFTV